MKTAKKTSLKTAYLNIVINSILWGLSPVFVKLALDQLSVDRFMFWRFLIAIIFTVPYTLYIFGFKRVFKSFFSIRNLIVMAFSMGITTYIMMVSLNYISTILFVIIGALRPIMADIIGAIMLKEKIEKNEIIGTLIAFIGTILFICIDYTSDSSGPTETKAISVIIGVVLALLGSLLWIVANIAFKKVKEDEKDIVSYNSFLFSIIFAVGILAINDRQGFSIPQVDLAGWLAIIFTAFGGGVFAMMTYQKALRSIEVSEANLFYYLQVVCAIPGAIIILHEDFNPLLLIPTVLILVGVYLNISKKFIKQKVKAVKML
jgi:drug/metabolite transporter (DMT)-like permease